MDDLTHSIISQFVDRLIKELRSRKEYNTIEVGTWSVTDNKVSLEVFLEKERKKIFFDIRELKENQTNFQHILENVVDQIKNLHLKQHSDSS